MKQSWYQVRAADDGVAEVQVTDFIGDWIDDMWGFGVTAKKFVDEIAAIPDSVKTIRVHINSPGGDVFAALNIANALRAQSDKGRKVETVVDGLAASAATLVMMAGAPVKVSDNAVVMIHNPWSGIMGTADELRKQAEVLDTLRDTIVTTYQWHVEMDAKDIKKLMDDETWMDADQAIEMGFADEKIEGLRAAASIDPERFAKAGLKVPERFLARVDELLVKHEPEHEEEEHEPMMCPECGGAMSCPNCGVENRLPVEPEPVPAALDPAQDEVTAKQVIGLTLAAGLDLAFVARLAATKDGWTLGEVEAEIASEKKRRDDEVARRAEVSAVCSKFGLSDLAPEMSGLTVTQAQLLVSKVLAKLDKVEIDATLVPDGTARGRSGNLSVTEVYALRNKQR